MAAVHSVPLLRRQREVLPLSEWQQGCEAGFPHPALSQTATGEAKTSLSTGQRAARTGR
jgi:hypothetical protein